MGKKKVASHVTVKDIEISIVRQNDRDYISLTDMLKAKEGQFFIDSWLRNRNTIEFLGIWETINNPEFNYVEFDAIKKTAGLNSFKLSVKEWVQRTGAIGIISKTGRYGGTYAHSDIAFEFGTWISPEFKLFLIKEFQRLKEQEQKLLNPDWDFRRFLSKVNYRIHTDAIKENLIPKYSQLSKEQEGYIYADEAEMLNIAVFGITSKQWKEENQKKILEGFNLRDMATIPQLTVLSNLENLNAHYIKEGMPAEKRLVMLKTAASIQLQSLMNYNFSNPIVSPFKEDSNTSTFDKSIQKFLPPSGKK